MGLFGGKTKMPAIEPPTPAPDPKMTEEARKRRAAIARQSSGFRAAQQLGQAGVRETLG